MFGFFVKKNFCNLWDDLFSVFVPGFIMMLVCGVSITAIIASGFIYKSYLAVAIVGILASSISFGFIFSFGDNALSLANWEIAPVKKYLSGIRKDFVTGVFFGAMIAILIIVLFLSVPYYLKLKAQIGVVALFLAGAIFWFAVIALFALQWFMPLHKLMSDDGFFKTLKKCFVVFFDNAGFSIAVFLHNCALFVFTSILLCSPAAMALSLMNAMRLRLYKYDWLEAHPELTTKAEREEVPWNELLKEDRDTLGPRSFRSFIFPWVK